MTIRVNVKTKVNNAKIKRETRDGREVVVLPSVTLPDNVVMNGIMYPADAIATSYQSLERTPAPLGHPISNGIYLSARDPQAINMSWVGAWNENVRRENGRVFMDKIVDVEVAMRHPEGKRLMEAVEKGEPIHTSTGVLMDKAPAPEGADYQWIATNMMFDHDAILLDEPGAAQPDQGVGIFVNSEGKEEELEVINSELPVDFMDFVTDMVMDEFERSERKNRWANLKGKLAEAIHGVLNKTKADGLTVNQDDEGNNMPVTDEQFKSLEQKVDKLVANASNAEGLKSAVAEAVGEAVKPLQEQIDQINEARTASEQAEREDLAKRVHNANLLDEEVAKGLEINALRALAEKVKQGKPAPMVPGFQPNAADQDDQKFWESVDLNANRAEGGEK